MTEASRHGRDGIADDRYVVLGRLGSGGAAEVYRARDTLLGREVALKVLREEHAGDASRVERFREEARSAASISHPNVVEVYELGASPEGAPFVAMEYVRGGTLKQKLSGSGAFEPAAAAATAAQISRALEAAHARGIVHRDVKPQNVLLDEASGRVKVADFGIAYTPSSVTDAGGEVFGTVRYMSPEQASGGTPGPGGDLYSLGAVLYEMLTGVPPFSGPSQTAVALKHVHEPPLPPGRIAPGIPEKLETLALELLAKNPADRPPDAATLAGRLDEAVTASRTPETGLAEPGPARVYRSGHPADLRAWWRGFAGNAGKATRRGRRRRLSAAAVGLTLLLAVLGLGLYGGGSAAPRVQGLTGAPGVPAQSVSSSETSGEALVHTADAGNIAANSTYLDIPAANGSPEAVLSITQSWNPGSRTGTYNPHPVGVWYDTERERWAIFNQDRAAMPEGASFNVVVLEGSRA